MIDKPCSLCCEMKRKHEGRSECMDCRRIYSAAYYLKTRERQIAYAIKYQSDIKSGARKPNN